MPNLRPTAPMLSAMDAHLLNVAAAAAAKKRKTGSDSSVAISSPGSSSTSSGSSTNDEDSAAVPNQFSAEAMVSPAEAEDTTGTDSTFHPHGPEFDTAVTQFSIQEHIIHFLHPNAINNITRSSVERAIVLEAGTIVTDDKTMDSNARNTLLVETYCQIVRGYEDHVFQPISIKKEMLTKMYQAKMEINGKQLWQKFKDVRADLRANFNISNNIPSGKQLRDVYNLFLVNMYKTHEVRTRLFDYFMLLMAVI
jgi:hypothetical protein